ncbi:hypothetical protein AHF37_07782 [Paragonimus kellicotti]|nr:hypothetical protein AHF37_07782 [Paragonimus kellicotti]
MSLSKNHYILCAQTHLKNIEMQSTQTLYQELTRSVNAGHAHQARCDYNC